METTRARLSGFLAIMVVLLTASAALGAVGVVTQATDEPVPSEAPVCPTDPGDEPTDGGTVDDGATDAELLGTETTEGDDDGTTDDEDGTTDDEDGTTDDDASECDEPADDDPPDDDAVDGDTDGVDETDDDGAPADPVDEERVTACETAAGIEPTEEPVDATDGDDEKPHGLDNAIERVLSNCVKNAQAPGLVNALEHLAANHQRHEEHEEWKAARAEERAAEKAARAAAKAAGEHGNAGGNGFGATHGGGNGVGHGNGNAGGNGHGNGHP